MASIGAEMEREQGSAQTRSFMNRKENPKKTASKGGAKKKAGKKLKPKPTVTPAQAEAKTEKKKGKKTISLEFAAKCIAITGVALRIQRHLSIRTVEQFVDFLFRVGANDAQQDAFLKLYDQELEGAISLAGLIAVFDDELAKNTANKQVDGLYALLRFLSYETPLLHSARFDTSRRELETKDHSRLMNMVWKMLENSPTVQAEISKQREASNLVPWKVRRRKSAMKNYGNIKDRLRQKFSQYKDDLRRALIDGEKKLNTTDGNLAPDSDSGATDVAILAPDKL